MEKITADLSQFDSVFDTIGKRWLLLTAGSSAEKGCYNTMTASWGCMGVLWGKNVAAVFVRPTRHTFGFIEREEYYTLSIFGDKYRSALNFCGSHSGRDTDKAAATGLTPVMLGGGVAFEQAETILICRKLYADDLRGGSFVDKSVLSANYKADGADLHRVYIGEITAIYR